jgi:cytochrome c peroxidase
VLVLIAVAVPSRAGPPHSQAIAPIGGSRADLVSLTASPPLGLPQLPVPERSALTRARVDLGRKLFFDRRLSFNGTLSCAMCHVPEEGFTQNVVRTPVGFEGRFVKRNTPTLLNVGYRRVLFHDGRESTLENQIWQPLLRANEMANPSIGFVLQTIRAAADYRGLFEEAFAQGLTAETLGIALASYQRGLLAADSPFDRWYFGDQADALDDAAIRGWRLFREKGCVSCHAVAEDHAQFTDDRYYDTGIGYARTMNPDSRPAPVRLAPGVELIPEVSFPGPRVSDLGRYEATGVSVDRWHYRVPTLRNVALTAPYMHDGSFPDLASVVAYYDRGGFVHPGLDPRLRPLGLSAAERRDLVSFLESLTGSDVQRLVADARSQPIGDVSDGGQ